MKTIDLTSEQHTLAELLKLARSEDVLIHSSSGDDYLLERADEFEREVAALGASDRFMSYLQTRSDESEELTLKQVRERQVDDEKTRQVASNHCMHLACRGCAPPSK